MQTKQYTISFSHCVMTDCIASAQVAIVEPVGFTGLPNSWKSMNSWKKTNSWKKREFLPPKPAPLV